MSDVNSTDELENSQVGLIRVDPNTGVAIGESGGWLKAGERCFIKFETEDDARQYALSRLREDPLSEWSLFDSGGRHIATFSDKQALIEATKAPKKLGFFSKWFDQ